MVECVGGKKYLGEEEKGEIQSEYTVWKNIFQRALNKIAAQAQHNSEDLKSR